IRIHDYQCAVDKLEGLVIQRLFELTKANVSHTAHTYIQKARSKVIQRALQAYNKATLSLDPPCPILTWVQIVEYTTITKFELLWMGAREDIRNLEWANARNHEAMICHLKILRAKEEIERLNIEIKCLVTWICDEMVALDQAIEECMLTQLLLAHAITQFADERKRINTNLQVRLYQIYSLHGFSG
ncbi:hypothetical protein K439DRAFT_1250444, partial [Ramaria rubella]